MAWVIQMSDRELTRLRVMIDLADDRLTVDAAATLMGWVGVRFIVSAGRFLRMARPVWRRANAADRATASVARPSGPWC